MDVDCHILAVIHGYMGSRLADESLLSNRPSVLGVRMVSDISSVMGSLRW